MKKIETPRLILRDWKPDDAAAFCAINQDAKVMEFMPKLLTSEESKQLIERFLAHDKQHGFSAWAVEEKTTHQMIGFISLITPSFEAHFTPCIEIGWRLASHVWGKGYATEGAKAVLEHAFKEIHLTELVSFTAFSNISSRRVMEKLGMTYNPKDDFEHPNLSKDHFLSKHVLYRIKNPYEVKDL